MQLIVRGNEIKAVECDNLQQVAQLKLAIAKAYNASDVSSMNLYLNGQPMQDEQILANYGLFETAAIDMDFGLAGGKVHGSLARAGKVRGQTPKVAKQEDKKKPKTGRAKRRIQYNRRFVNVVAGPGGRRKGPNAGAGVQAS
ncbi:small subunit ribosomal S30e [Brachionus plicatilis]|uniref:Small subunit ribosomal S30e n=1 Tax=Brachionus plicatilis TaxID=10195 RepID=A0A3M7S3Q4_BRAPC|nr:small subunit ribosomal S30e [Brachionus plicatilis]